MNDRLADSLLKLVASSAASRVPLLPDEPTFNFVTRIDWLTGGVNRRQVVADLFGNPATNVARPLHAGFEHFAQRLAASELSGRELARAHSMLGFFSPFAIPSRYQRALDFVCGGSAAGIFEIIGARESGLFRVGPACCIDCVAADARNHAPPHYRRAHLVAASQVCSEHGTPLTEYCESCGVQLRYTDLPSTTCRSCGASLRPGQLPAGTTNASLVLKLAKVIQASLDGTLAAPDEAIRLAVLRERVSVVIESRSDVVGDNLSRHLIRCYGRPFLQALCLVPDEAPMFGWPALLIHGRLLSADPVANCLLIASLFESAAEYNDAASAFSVARAVPQKHPKPVGRSQQITGRTLRDILGPERLVDVAKRHDVNEKILHRWVAAYPGLSERRKRFAVRMQVHRCKRRIQEYVREYPGHSRTQATAVRSEIAYVLRHDKTWLDQHLPVRAKLTGAMVLRAIKPAITQDLDLAAALRETVGREAAMLSRPRRLTPDRVLRLSGLGALSSEERAAFVETSRVLKELSEAVVDYYQRCLVWAAKDLVRCQGKCDHIVELFVHAGVSREHVRKLEAFAMALIGKGQTADNIPVLSAKTVDIAA